MKAELTLKMIARVQFQMFWGDPSSATFARLERIEHYLIERFNKIEEATE